MWLKYFWQCVPSHLCHRLPIFLIWTVFGSFPLFLTQALALFFSIASFCSYLCFFFFLCPVSLLHLLNLLYFFLSSAIFSFLPTHFSCLLAYFNYLFAFDLSYVVQDHVMFLSFNVHGMIYYKVAFGTKGRPNLRTCDVFGGQWWFVHLPYALREVRKNFPRKLQGLNRANRREKIRTRKWNCVYVPFTVAQQNDHC